MQSFTFNLCTILINAGRTTDLHNKLDVFFANNRLTNEEYTELVGMLGGEN